jgi:hypothetical protein
MESQLVGGAWRARVARRSGRDGDSGGDGTRSGWWLCSRSGINLTIWLSMSLFFPFGNKLFDFVHLIRHIPERE